MTHITDPVMISTPTGTLVFGMHWFPLVGGKPDAVGRRLARRHRSTHMILPEGTLGAIGIVTLKSRLSRASKLYSAAQNIAQLYASGTTAVLIELEGIGYWLVAVHEGAVVARTDQLYHDMHEADEVIASLRQAYPHLRVVAASHMTDLPTLEALNAASSVRTQLQPVKRWAPLMPRPVQYFVLALLLVALLPRLWQAYGRTRHVPVVHTPTAPAQAWRAAVMQSGQQRVVHGVSGTRALLDALYSLPVSVGGWLLRQAECQPDRKYWQCRANYQRHDDQATNKSFLAAMPVIWKVDFSSLDHITSSWRVDAYGVPLIQLKLPTTDELERNLVSALQDISAGFAQLRVGRPAPVPLSAPTDERGQDLMRPTTLPVYRSRSVHITGPLRSASLLLPHVSVGAWEKAILTLGRSDRPSLKHSRLNLSLQGVFYETNLPMAGRLAAVRCAPTVVGHCDG